eukprot:TRINITY_DN7303_c0_g1_i2.p1 TRINITY_DN7303_c0_g1~~TRINITY_DN7303_c0_g1_i2.p1  ORF type:complete len:155 (+),score=24.61 TRINITY_DN7303_c0_g1_i2:400-864(+)
MQDIIQLATAEKEVGNKYYISRNIKDAFETYEKALDYFRYCFPDDEDEKKAMNQIKIICYSNQASCMLQIKNYRKGLACCQEVIKLNPNHMKCIFKRGQCFAGLGDFNEAKNDFLRALQQDPENKTIKSALRKVIQNRSAYLKKKKEITQRMFT